MKWFNQKKRIRRFLRDPDGNIWSDAMLLRLYNNAQQDVAREYGKIEGVDVIRIPPIFQGAYLYDWEWRYSSPLEGWTHQALSLWDQGGYVFSSRWEPEELTRGSSNTPAFGDNYTQPWEAWMVLSASPATSPPVWFPEGFDKTIGLYWDKDPLIPTTKKELMQDDRTWRTRSGSPQMYYRSESLENYHFIYPFPSTVDWDDIVQQITTVSYVGTFDWEDTYYGCDFITTEDSTNEQWYMHPWELNYVGDPESGIVSRVSTDLFHDAGIEPDSPYGIALFDSGADETSDFGIIIDEDGSAVDSDVGAGTDIIDAAGQLLLISQKTALDLASEDDESLLPSYIQKYVEYGALELAYRANTDGRIPSLAEYWGWRKEIAYKAIFMFKNKRRMDRTYCFRTHDISARSVRRRPRLPDTYPAQI